MRALKGLPLILLLLAGACAEPEATAPDASALGPAFAQGSDLTPVEQLGKSIYFDKSLSLHNNQSCATCHDPDFGFTGPFAGINLRGSVYMGSVGNAFGDRKPPSAAYATLAPVFHYDGDEGLWLGGNFWDGRATGEETGNPAGDQALGPFLNPVEQALPDTICVLYRIAEGPYADLWTAVYGTTLEETEFPQGLDKACRGKGDVPDYYTFADLVAEEAYQNVGRSIAAFEASTEVNAFTSKFDMFGDPTDNPAYTAEEQLGWEVFNDPELGNCAACHPAPLFTDFSYDNLGMPSNPLNPKTMALPGWKDPGLAATVNDDDLLGNFKVPTLRNVAKAPGDAPKAFGHNGVFKSLEQIVHFYNTRDALGDWCEDQGLQVLATPNGLGKMGYEPLCWLTPDYPGTMNTEELGNLGLSAAEEAAIVAFLKTLSDGYTGR